MKTRIALLGQPNSGKSTVYNALTGSRQHVGNWPGKTVEKNDGFYTYKGTKYTVTDEEARQYFSRAEYDGYIENVSARQDGYFSWEPQTLKNIIDEYTDGDL